MGFILISLHFLNLRPNLEKQVLREMGGGAQNGAQNTDLLVTPSI